MKTPAYPNESGRNWMANYTDYTYTVVARIDDENGAMCLFVGSEVTGEVEVIDVERNIFPIALKLGRAIISAARREDLAGIMESTA